VLLAGCAAYTTRYADWITSAAAGEVIQVPCAYVQASVSKHETQFGAGLLRPRHCQGALLTPVDKTAPLDAAAQAQLLARVASAQDRQAFALLFKHFAPRIKAFHLRAGLSDTAAEELAQETMLLLWRKAASFDPARAGAATWVFTIARNLRIDQARRQRGNFAEPPPEVDISPSAETLSLECERAQRIRGALATLSVTQRRVIELSFFADTPHSGIATALNIPLGTVKSRIRLALARLREALGTEP
jgi:RNA polymerase sigma-70 factor (ECF subfamily)